MHSFLAYGETWREWYDLHTEAKFTMALLNRARNRTVNIYHTLLEHSAL